MNTWEEIRTSWVNGNITDAKEALYQQSKMRILRIVSEALDAVHESIPNGMVTSGDLTDLREILRSYGRGV